MNFFQSDKGLYEADVREVFREADAAEANADGDRGAIRA